MLFLPLSLDIKLGINIVNQGRKSDGGNKSAKKDDAKKEKVCIFYFPLFLITNGNKISLIF